MSLDLMHPGLSLLGAALLVAVLPLGGRRVACVVAPALALLQVALLPEGESAPVDFLGLDLVLVRGDSLAHLFGLVFAAVALLGNLYGWYRTRRVEQVSALVYAAGGMGVVYAGDLMTMLMAWEVMAVSSALLVFAGRDRQAPAAGQRYLMVHLAAGGLLLLGVLLVVQGGETAFDRLWGTGAGAWLIVLALCINAAVPPLHAWLPDAYPRGSVSGSVFLSAFTTKAAVYCLIRGFAGSDVLMWAGAIMAVYGVTFAVMENHMRRLLAYHIVSQVGYMVCGVGIGSALALNGSAAHAFCHILYKGLLFMAVGAVVHQTGREKLSELGGLARRMPVSLVLYMIGALSISGLPLFNGFVSKSLIVSASGAAHETVIGLLLSVASVGTFLSVGLKLPYFAWFARPTDVRCREAPLSMHVAMGLAAAACIVLGVLPGWLYDRLPGGVDYHPYTAAHVLEMLLLAWFCALVFLAWRRRLEPHPGITLDTDWIYRRPAAWFVPRVAAPLERLYVRCGAGVARLVEMAGTVGRNPPEMLRRLAGRSAMKTIRAPLPPYDALRQQPALFPILAAAAAAFVVAGLVFVLAA